MNISNEMMREYINYCYYDLQRVGKEAGYWVTNALMKVCLKRKFFILFLKILISDAGVKAFFNKLWSR